MGSSKFTRCNKGMQRIYTTFHIQFDSIKFYSSRIFAIQNQVLQQLFSQNSSSKEFRLWRGLLPRFELRYFRNTLDGIMYNHSGEDVIYSIIIVKKAFDDIFSTRMAT